MKNYHLFGRIQACGWAAVSCLALVAGAAVAQQPTSGAAQAESAGLEEIVVTAEKRAENVQSVPIAITAISAEVLEQKGITNISQLSNMAPNVNLDAGTPFSGSDTVLSAYIRGIGQDDFAFNLDPGVGVYVDGIYLARSVGANTTMLDVDRVEILKGPQGTLFGRNSIGGAISIVTRDPGNEFSMKGEVTTGSLNRMDAKLTFDVPFTENILSTLSITSEKRDGYQKDIPYVQSSALSQIPGAPPGALAPGGMPSCAPLAAAGSPTCPYQIDNPQNFPASGYQSANAQGGIDKWSARGKIVFKLADELKLTVSADYLNVDQEASPNTAIYNPLLVSQGLTPITNLCLLGVTGPFGAVCTSPRGGLSPTPTPMASSFPLAPGGVGLNSAGSSPYTEFLPFDGRYNTGNIDTSYANGNNFSKLQNEGVSSVLAWTINPDMGVKWIQGYRHLDWTSGMDLDGSPETYLATSFAMGQHQTSEELQLNGKTLYDKLDYAVGYYFFEEGGYLHDFVTFPPGTLQVDGPNTLDTTANALYAHLDYKLDDHWGVTLGGRQTWEHKTFQGYQTDDNGFSYKISGCLNPLASANTFPGFGAVPAGVTCQQVLGFPVAGHPYDYYPTGPFTQNYTNFSPTAGLQYHIDDDMMLYTYYSKGYKTGSWTTRLSDPHPTYDSSLHFNPEFATSEELGFKSEFLNHTMRSNAALFHTKYDNIQLNSQVGVSPTIVNAGDATIYGAEEELEWLIGQGLSLTGSAGYTHAAYDTLNDVTDNGYLLTKNSCPESSSNAPAPAVIPTGATLAQARALQQAVANSFQNGVCELPKTPKFKAYIGPQYIVNLPNTAQLQFNADVTYTTHEFNDIGNTWQLERPDMTMVNASLTYRTPSKQWDFVVGGTNISDRRYVVSGQNQGGLPVIDASYSPPREWYATFRFKPNMK